MQADDAFEGYARVLCDAVGLFEALRLRYALAGGLAAMIYGRARFTEDVDFVLLTGYETTLVENPQIMQRFRFDPSCTYMLYHESGVDIDLWKDAHADAIVQRAQPVVWQNRRVFVAEAHDVIAMKLRADRPQDDYDISEILKNTLIDDAVVAQRVEKAEFDRYRLRKKRIGLD